MQNCDCYTTRKIKDEIIATRRKKRQEMESLSVQTYLNGMIQRENSMKLQDHKFCQIVSIKKKISVVTYMSTYTTRHAGNKSDIIVTIF